MLNHRYFKGLGKEPGEQSPADPVHPEDFCEETDCEYLDYDADEWRCKDGRDPVFCIEEATMDEDTKGDMEYHRKVEREGNDHPYHPFQVQAEGLCCPGDRRDYLLQWHK